MNDYERPKPNFLEPESTRSRSKKHEKKVAKTGERGRLTPGSGSGFIKGDVIKCGRVIECKVTQYKQYILKQEELHKLVKQAGRKDPVFVIGFDEGKENWAVIPLERYEELVAEERERNVGRQTT